VFRCVWGGGGVRMWCVCGCVGVYVIVCQVRRESDGPA